MMGVVRICAVIRRLERPKQEGWESKASLGHIINSSPSQATDVSKQTNNNNDKIKVGKTPSAGEGVEEKKHVDPDVHSCGHDGHQRGGSSETKERERPCDPATLLAALSQLTQRHLHIHAIAALSR